MNARGFTLIETMVAMVVMSVGVLGLSASAAVTIRQMTGGRRIAGATMLAQARFEQLEAQDCTKLTNGTATTQGYSESWTVTPVTRAVKVAETVSFAGERWHRTQAYTTILSCPANP